MGRSYQEPLTDRQCEVLRLIVTLTKRQGFPPTRREIAQALGIGANAATGHLASLAKKGVIELVPHITRGIRVLRAEAAQAESDG